VEKSLQPRRGRGLSGISKADGASTTIPGRVSIHARDEGINERLTLGHWESDSVIYTGSGGQRLSVQTERKARFIQIHRLPSGSAQHTLDALRETICSVPQDLVKTITFDNGSEGVLHEQLGHDYFIKTFFCDTYASYQKGGVEQANSLIRRELPRGTDLRTISDQQIYAIQKRRNDTPRKILGYLTPREVLFNLPPKVVH
jgi:transposase, IS30 family